MQQLKNEIEKLINDNRLDEAKESINKYKFQFAADADIYSMLAVIAMLEGQFGTAQEYLNSGYQEDNMSFDIVYNQAYLYELQEFYDKALRFYQKALGLINSSDINLKKNIFNKIDILQEYVSQIRKKVLIGSPIHQKPEILKEFLLSLNNLDTNNLDIWFAFIDDNRSELSIALLKEFASKQRNVIIYKNENDEDYYCDEITHRWKEDLIWKVAQFKDNILSIAIEYEFDYVFLIDSDILLHPNTLKRLIDTKKDIISNIFWTKWTPEMPALPQVWLSDTYTQHFCKREEKLTNDEILIRRQQFLDQLKVPGTYEVGGLGACTLISKQALKKGVNFQQIKNLSFWGEDRHFCVRAAALGIPLYVDTYYPAFHIYRETDLEEVKEFKYRIQNNIYNYKKVLTMVYTNYSGSNTVALSKLIPEKLKSKFDIDLIKQDNSELYFKKILNSDIVVTTEGNYIFNKNLFNENQIVIDLWHGFPLKAMGYVDKGEASKDAIKKIWENVNYVGSYSQLFNELMNKCIEIDCDKYIITGAPRNDLLFISDGKRSLQKILGRDVKLNKILLYVPTYRYTPRNDRHDGDRPWLNLFDIPNFNEKEFNDYLFKNNIILIVKLHPAEEGKYANLINNYSNIVLLTERMLQDNNIEFYETLNAIDILLTDYSSIYFDFLLLNKPIIFIPTDLQQYAENRGFLLEPYDDWTPGSKVYSQQELENQIINLLNNPTIDEEKRNKIKLAVHKHSDCFSSLRVAEFINDLF